MTLETEKAYGASMDGQGLEGAVLLECDCEITVLRTDSAGRSLVRVEGVYRALIR